MFQLLTVLVAALPFLSFVHAKHVTNDDKAKLTLPWGTYEAEPYGEDESVSLRPIPIKEYIPFQMLGSY